MSTTSFSSKLLENAVNEFASLPGIGRKTALRLVMNLLRRDTDEVVKFGETIIKLRTGIRYCKICNNISDTDICSICSDKSRDTSIICTVENIQDVMAIENTHQFKGLYHVLGGIISPIEGIGPS
ncbi:MAG TPA: toprim domain-containing protein, partial [Bacteroidales bacterium]|nr:toprim domain-containing protein [Bacteroidales bacterium]